MTMPEATVNHDSKLAPNEGDIWLSWEVRSVDAVAGEAEFAEQFADNQLWLCVLAANTAHVLATVHSEKWLHGEVQGQIRDVLQPFAVDHDRQHVGSILQAKRLNRLL